MQRRVYKPLCHLPLYRQWETYDLKMSRLPDFNFLRTLDLFTAPGPILYAKMPRRTYPDFIIIPTKETYIL